MKKNKNNSNPTGQFILKNQVVANTDDGERQVPNSRQRHALRKQPTGDRIVHDIDSSFNEAHFEKIIYLNRLGNFEEYVEYLDPKCDQKTKTIFWTSEHSFTISQQDRCVTI